MTRQRFTTAIIALILAGSPMVAAPKPYPLAVAPDKAVERLSKLEKASGLKFALTADELDLFAEARSGTLKKYTFADACLIASGITDPAYRKKYVAQIDSIEADARKALAGAKTTREKGERLLKFLHAGPMAKGYESEQTNLQVVLESGTFNCVSSAVLYNIVGRRLGLSLVAMEVPGHVYSILCDGEKRMDVETTNAEGFDPKQANKIKRRGGSNAREVGETGLAAIIAYNHGVKLANAKRHGEALLANLRSLGLDPVNPAAANNALANLTNWPMALAEAGKYEEALTTIGVCLSLTPKHAALANNHLVIWQNYAQTLAKDGKIGEALAVLRRAKTAVPTGEFEKQQAFLYVTPAEKHVEAGDWEEALKVYAAGLAKVDPNAKKTLTEARTGTYFRWCEAYQQKGEFSKAVEILRRGHSLNASDGRFKNNTVAVYDAWANTHVKQKDWDGAIRVYEEALKHLPGDGHLSNNLDYCKQEKGRAKGN